MKIIQILFLIWILQNNLIAQKKINIAILTEEISDTSKLNLVKSEIKAVLGMNYQVNFKAPLTNNYNLEKARSNYLSLEENKIDLIVANGITNSILFNKIESIKIPTIIINGVNKDLVKLPISQNSSQKHNLNYLIFPNSYTEDLNDFSSIYTYQKIGIIIHKKKIESLPLQKHFDSYFSDKAASYKFIPLENNKIDSSLLNNVDAVYIADGISLNDLNISNIIQFINNKKLPSFSANGINDVKKGVLASNKPGRFYKQMLIKTALHSESILNGKNPYELPIFIEYNNLLTVNYSTVKLVGINLRYSILGEANIIGKPTNTTSKNAFSLKDIMSLIATKNLSLQVEKKNIELTEQDIKKAKSNYLPNATANLQGVYIDPNLAQYSTGQSPEIEGKGDVTLKQIIYSPDVSAGIKINKKLNEAQKETYNTAELNALLNGANSYFNALILKTNLNIQNQNLQFTKQNLKIAKQNFEVGTSGKADVLRFKSQLAQNTQNVIDANNQLKQTKITINQLINSPLSNELELEDADITNSTFKDYYYKSLIKIIDSPNLLPKLISFFLKESKENAPELKAIDYNIEAIDLNYKLNSNARFIPTVALQGQYNVSLFKDGKGSQVPIGYPTLPNNHYNAGLSISLPIFNQNTRNIDRQTAKIQGEQLDFQKQSIIQNLEKQIQEIVLDLISSVANIEISEISEETAKENLELTQVAYQNGSTTIIQLIDAQNNYIQSKLGSATAKYKFLLTSLQLERIMGRFFIRSSPEENSAFFNKANKFIHSVTK